MIDFVTSNYVEIFAALGAAVSLASIIVKLTPNKKDDEIVGYLRKALELLSLKIANK